MANFTLRAASRSDDVRASWQRAADLLTEAGEIDYAQRIQGRLAELG
ncbi:MAG TPA: hypothetical protein VFX70_05355 [Mycobacteriales bacterium]|nr:hypothetical protein [Mycobacteriales bacterium]